jgi:NTE family protein
VRSGAAPARGADDGGQRSDLSLLTQHRLIDDIEKHSDDAHLVVLPPPCPLAIAPTDFAHAELLMERGYADACKFLDGGGADRPPIRMRMHRHHAPAARKLAAHLPG